MRRRTLLTATAAAGPVTLLTGLDDALANTPAPVGTGPLDARLSSARTLYDKGRHSQLLAALPALIADGHSAAASRQSLDQARLSSVYSLASAVLRFNEQERQLSNRSLPPTLKADTRKPRTRSTAEPVPEAGDSA